MLYFLNTKILVLSPANKRILKPRSVMKCLIWIEARQYCLYVQLESEYLLAGSVNSVGSVSVPMPVDEPYRFSSDINPNCHWTESNDSMQLC